MDKVLYFLKLAWKNNKKLFLIVVGHNLFEAILSIVTILGIGIVVDTLVIGKSNQEVRSIILTYVLVHFGISLIREFLVWSKNKELRKATNEVQYNYAWQSLTVDFKCIQTQEFLNLKKNSMRIMPAFYITEFGKFISYIVKFIGIFSTFAIINPILIIGILILSIPSIFLSFRQKKEEYNYKLEMTLLERNMDYLYKTMTEYHYAKDIKIYHGQEMLCHKYKENGEEQIKKQSKLGQKNLKIQNSSYLFGAMQLLCILIYFSYMVYNHEISIAEYTILLSSTTLFSSILVDFFDNIASIKTMCNYSNLVEEYDLFIANNSNVYCNEAIENCNLDSMSIEFEHVYFKYPNTEKMILENISFQILDGEKVSFVGLNGAGKTTILKLLLRLYEPTSGTIKVNGIDISKLNAKEYYEHIGIVLQDFFIFSYSVIENLCFDEEVDMSKIETVIKEAGIEERIARLPKGVYTSLFRDIDKEGVELSGGEGQKLAMARALYKSTSLLLLDEPTSSLDPFAEYEWFAKMRQISQNKTTILVSHRLSSTKYSDRIFVFDNGKLVQNGSHIELINITGIYQNLFFTQAKYYMREGESCEG